MKLLQFLCVLFTLVAGVSMSGLRFLPEDGGEREATQAPPCYPPQWESRINVKILTFNGTSKTLEEAVQIQSFDQINLRRRTSVTTYINGVVESVITYIAIYSDGYNGAMYEIDEATGKCSVITLQANMPTDCLLPKTKPGEKRKIGYNPTLEVHNYGFKEPGYSYQVVAQDKPDNIIIPFLVAEQFVDEFKRYVSNNYEYVDFTTGIKDPSIFDEPKGCQKVEKLDKATKGLKHFMTW